MACWYDLVLSGSLMPIQQLHYHAIAMFRSQLNPSPRNAPDSPVHVLTDHQVKYPLQQEYFDNLRPSPVLQDPLELLSSRV